MPVEMSGVVSPAEIKAPQPKPFQPQILKRPPQPSSGGPSSERATPAPTGQTWTQQAQDEKEGQRKSALLSLFTAPMKTGEKAVTPVSPLPDFVTGAVGQSRSQRPSVTGVTGVGVGSGDEDIDGRSRISSIASGADVEVGEGKSRQVSLTGMGMPGVGVGVGSKEETPVTSPVVPGGKVSGSQSDTDFLLGFLQGIAKSAEGMKR